MSHYLKKGFTLWPVKEGTFDIRTPLPVGTYAVRASPEGFFLEPITDFNITGKIYGKTNHMADRILSTFEDRPHTTGVLLNGEKGSGKTMLAKLVSQQAAENGISTIVVNASFYGDGFNTFLQSIEEPTIVIFDEFEKVYDDNEQEQILTLLDGVFPTKKLYILTVNDKYRVNSHMRNRPGRIFYMIEFKGLDVEFIEEYCRDNLNNKDYIQQICRLTMLFDSFNFDMLKALVEEMNRYNESPNQAMEMLNAKPYDAGHIMHNVEVFSVSGEKLDPDRIYPTTIRGNPIAHEELEFHINLNNLENNPEHDGDDDENTDITVAQKHLKKIDPEAGVFTYVINEDSPDQMVFRFTRESYKTKQYNWLDAF